MSEHGDPAVKTDSSPVMPSVRERTLSGKGIAYTKEQKGNKLSQTFRQLKIKSDQINNLIAENEADAVRDIHSIYAEWLGMYENFLMQDQEYIQLLSPGEIDAYVNDKQENRILFLKNFKVSVENWTQANVPGYIEKRDNLSKPSKGRNKSVGSGATSRATSLSLARLHEEQKQAEIAAKRAALKEKRQIELAKLSLSLQEEEHLLKTELAISDAKAQLIKKYERSEDDIMSVEQDLKSQFVYVKPELSKLNVNVPEFKTSVTHETTVDQILCVGESGQAGNESGLLSNGLQMGGAHGINGETVCRNSGHLSDNFGPADGSFANSHHAASVFPQHVSDSISGAITPSGQVHNVNYDVVRHLRKPSFELKKFGGNPMEFRKFLRQFQAKVSANTDSYDEKMNFLEQYTFGEANRVVAGFSHLDAAEGFPAAITELTDRYGDTQVIAHAFIKKALDWPSIRPDDVKSLDEFALFLVECENAVRSIEQLKILEYSENMKRLVCKLPFYLHDRWRSIVQDTKLKGETASFQKLVHFIKADAKKSSDPVYGKEALGADQKLRSARIVNPPARVKSKSSFAAVNETKDAICDNEALASQSKRPDVPAVNTMEAPVQQRRDTVSCSYCNKPSHKLSSCWKFISLSIGTKQDHLKNKGLCFGCLKPFHIRRNCRKIATCETCGKKHPTALHFDEAPVSSSKCGDVTSPGKSDVDVCSRAGSSDAGCAMSIIPVCVKLKNKVKSVQTYAFYDTGSSVSFITDSLLSELGVSGKQMRLRLDTMGTPYEMKTQVVSGLQACDVETGNTIDLPKLYSKDKLPVSLKHIPTQEDLDKWPHLRNIEFKRPDVEIGLMLGSNIPDAYAPFEVRTGPRGSPHATRTPLGWVVWNVVRGDVNSDETQASAIVNRAEVTAIREAEGLRELDYRLRESFNMDFPERLIEDRKENSVEDDRFMEKMNKSICMVDGHYSMDLPFRDSKVVLPNNEALSRRRLKGLKNKMAKNDTFKRDYTEFMENIIEKGYAEKIPAVELDRNDGRVWYIPHHGVYHPRKPTKIRVVFDCSASFQGVSLNQQLLQGPDLANNLLNVLLKFRQGPIAIMGDIEAMFFQVRVTPFDTDCLRFFWYPEGNLDAEPIPYRMLVHLFGAVSSPTCANLALRRTANDHSDGFESVVRTTIEDNMYVDDLLASTRTEDEAIALINDTTCLCAKGGFNLTKWISNSCTVLEAIPQDKRTKNVKEVNLDSGVLPSERALGVFWSVQQDVLGFKISIKDHTFKRRGVLSIVSSVYDPIGLAAPFVLRAKILLQELCRRELSWDDVISDKEIKVWQNWLSEIPKLERLQIARCYTPSDFGDVKTCQIHTFCDASIQGYGVVSYVRLTDEYDAVQCALLMSKGRVAPLKKISVPRLELTAAAVAVRLGKVLISALDYQIDQMVYWTDSMTVLRYLSNESARFHTFVANRVALIRDATSPSQWRHINTELNPADCVSRGLTIDKLLQHKQWQHGPDFLMLNEQSWPTTTDERLKVSSDDPEVKEVVSVSAHVDVGDAFWSELEGRFSSWLKLRKTVGWILLAMDNLKEKVVSRKVVGKAVNISDADPKKRRKLSNDGSRRDQSKLVTKGLSLGVEYIEKAEKVLLRHTQMSNFPDDYKTVDSGKTKLKRSSKLYKLDPFMEDGLLRVGGRLERAHIPYDAKHPIILPQSSKISKLIVDQIHRQIGHLGKNSIMSELRQKYWVIGASGLIKGHLRRCVTCRRYQAPTAEQKMAHLPANRLTPDEPPFTRTGCDHFGPFEIKRGRTVVKRYGVIFTCMSTRAVHLELACSLDTNACINALRRFIARRGPVKTMHSDNGTNLVGAERELRESIESWNTSKIQDYAAQKGISWHFNPPAASHFGGVWERLIRSVRKFLYSLAHEQIIKLDDDGMQTLFCEVESILNNRPLTESPSSPNELDVLTPNHFLLLKQGEYLPPGTFDETDNFATRRWKQVQYLANVFWTRWTREYLPLLQQRQKWLRPQQNIQIGDIVLVVDNSPRNSWCLGRVTEVIPDKAGMVRSAKSIWF